MKINEKGFWECAAGSADILKEHYNDSEMIHALISFLSNEKPSKVVDLGCGTGYYAQQMRQSGINVDCFDGNPNTPSITDGKCKVLDLSSPHQLETYDWVLSFEVGEHLPKQYEDIFIQNLHSNNKRGIILSWAVKGQGGKGHFNEQNNDYVKEKIMELGYTNDILAENFLREASSLSWFKKTIMVFRKVK